MLFDYLVLVLEVPFSVFLGEGGVPYIVIYIYIILYIYVCVCVVAVCVVAVCTAWNPSMNASLVNPRSSFPFRRATRTLNPGVCVFFF